MHFSEQKKKLQVRKWNEGKKCCFNFAFVSYDIYFSRVFLCARSRRIVKKYYVIFFRLFVLSYVWDNKQRKRRWRKFLPTPKYLLLFYFYSLFFNFDSIRIREKNSPHQKFDHGLLQIFRLFSFHSTFFASFLYRLVLLKFHSFCSLNFSSVAYA